MRDYILELVDKYRAGGILIDTNLLLLLFVGGFKPKLIGKFKRLSTYVPEDYVTLTNFIARFKSTLTTPNILTEVSNLAGQLKGKDRVECFSNFSNQLTVFTEFYIESCKAASEVAFPKLGLTDAAITILAREQHLVLTDDFSLYQRILGAGFDAINFNHIRTLYWE